MRARSQGNTVQFLLDGENFFHALRDELAAVERSPINANTYVRLAYWEAEHRLRLDSPTTGRTLETALKAVADAGHRVEMILWQPASIDRTCDPGLSQAVYNTNKATIDHIDGYRGKRIRVYFEVYNGWVAGTSNHQKIAIFSIGGRLRVLVGGINLASFYWDSHNHTFAPPYAGGAGINGWSCHDTAVLLTGPATLDVEKEWLRRWNKQFSLFSTERPARAPALRNPAVPNSATVEVLTTNSESPLGREADIHATLIEKISRATQYIYLENYAFCDPGLVTALRKRLIEHRTLKLIIMVPHPFFGMQPFNYLARIAYAKLALANCVTCTANGTQVFRRDCETWDIKENWNVWSTAETFLSTFRNRWFESDTLTYKRRSDRTATTVPLADITAFDGGVRFYTPVRRAIGGAIQPIYIHSKLALIDDELAFVGTSNFSYRSMVYDGEISICTAHRPTVQNIRNTLLTHWGLNVPNVRMNWDTEVRRFRNSAAPGLGVLALDINEFDRYPFPIPNPLGGGVQNDANNQQYKYMNFTFY